ncbi:hypothetical protein Tco_0123431 [Tanacetum coccineum]
MVVRTLDVEKYSPTVVHEDNAACIAQLKKSGGIIVQKFRSSDNLPDLFTKTLPIATSKKLVHDIGMRRLNELK